MEFTELENNRVKCSECKKEFSKDRRKLHIRMWHIENLPENFEITEKNKLHCKSCKENVSRQSWEDQNPYYHSELDKQKT